MPNKQAEVQSGPLSAFVLIGYIFLGLFIFVAAVLTLISLLLVIRSGSTSYYAVSTDSTPLTRPRCCS